MHVAFYSGGWPPEIATSGIATYTEEMRDELHRLGHRVTLITATTQRDDGNRVYGIDASRWGRFVRRVRLKLAADRDDVYSVGSHIAEQAARIHCRDPIDVLEMEESFGWAAEVISARRFAVVVKLHGPAFLTMPEADRDTEAMQRRIHREGAGLASARVITAPSQCTLEKTFASYALDPPISAKVVNPISPAGLDLWTAHSSSRDTILFVGRFDETKGADRVLLAFKAILSQRHDLRLTFVGPDVGIRVDGDRLVHFEEYARSLFSADQLQRINYVGRKSPKEIAALRCHAALTVVASRWETQGYTALEAMLQGCPLVCSDTSGLGESVQHGVTGLLFHGDDIDGLAMHILRLLDDRVLAEELGQRARKYVLATHAPEVVVEQALEVYRAAISDFHRHDFAPA